MVIAAMLVFIPGNGVLGLIVAGVMASRFLSSASQILVRSHQEWQLARKHPGHR